MYQGADAKGYWKRARNTRRLTLSELAERLSGVVGESITRDQLSNWEYKDVRNPRPALQRAITWQLQEWRREDSVVKEESEVYGIDHTCGACQGRVPGPQSGADYCLLCGAQFGFRVCTACGAQETREAALFCVACGAELGDV